MRSYLNPAAHCGLHSSESSDHTEFSGSATPAISIATEQVSHESPKCPLLHSQRHPPAFCLELVELGSLDAVTHREFSGLDLPGQHLSPAFSYPACVRACVRAWGAGARARAGVRGVLVGARAACVHAHLACTARCSPEQARP